MLMMSTRMEAMNKEYGANAERQSVRRADGSTPLTAGHTSAQKGTV